MKSVNIKPKFQLNISNECWNKNVKKIRTKRNDRIITQHTKNLLKSNPNESMLVTSDPGVIFPTLVLTAID